MPPSPASQELLRMTRLAIPASARSDTDRTTRWAGRRHSWSSLPILLCLGGLLACHADRAASSESVATRTAVPAPEVAQRTPASAAGELGWGAVGGILKRIVPPTFPA